MACHDIVDSNVQKRCAGKTKTDPTLLTFSLQFQAPINAFKDLSNVDLRQISMDGHAHIRAYLASGDSFRLDVELLSIGSNDDVRRPLLCLQQNTPS